MAERGSGLLSGAVKGVTGAAGETVKTAGGMVGGATEAASGAAQGAAQGVPGAKAVETVGEGVGAVGEGVQAAASGAGGALERAGGRRTEPTLRDELRQIMREAALEVLVPVARTATTRAAKYAVTRSPELARDALVPKVRGAIEEAGGPGALAKRALSSVSKARSEMSERLAARREEEHPWRDRPVPIENAIDVGVPVESAYDCFAEFEEYAHVLSHGEIVDERQDERIEWRRSDGGDAMAVVTFHPLSDRLTRVMVDYDHRPHNMVEMATSLTLARRLNADLMRFKAFAEMSLIEQPDLSDATAPQTEQAAVHHNGDPTRDPEGATHDAAAGEHR
ncbi:MAG TPA: hypothetical protein VE571_00455 [Solirubrobacteraceae bacterium]|jgi:uncharacterized membrane protein|nr:hypothetical protein [Solirubrobacteraceae bacterium]